MRNKCVIKNCETPNISTKVNEDFEAIIYGICWKCGNRLKEIIGYELMDNFKFVLNIIENEVE